MKYYKVVRKEKRGRFSVMVPSDNRFRRSYNIGEWTEARKGSLLFIFTHKHGANNFLVTWCPFLPGQRELWECEVEGISEKIVSVSCSRNFQRYASAWNGNSPLSWGSHFCPPGTIGAKRVKLIKEIK